MTTELHCSACDAIVPRGSQFCPGCGLQLAAIAQPAVHVEKPRFRLWPVVLGALFIFIIIAHEADRMDAAKRARELDSFTADVGSGRLNTPGTFAPRCGAPRWATVTANGPALHYYTGQDIFVTLSPNGTQFQVEHVYVEAGNAKSYRTTVGPEYVLHLLGRK